MLMTIFIRAAERKVNKTRGNMECTHARTHSHTRARLTQRFALQRTEIARREDIIWM